MGTRSIILLRDRTAKSSYSTVTCPLGGPNESHYQYEYFAFIQQSYDGYVEGGIGGWLTNFLIKFIHEFTNARRGIDAGILGTKLISEFSSTNQFQTFCLMRMEPLKDVLQNDYDYIYIITFNNDDTNYIGVNDKSIMLSVYDHGNYILTARPEKFLKKYKHYKTQMEEEKKSFEEIDYRDYEVRKEGYLLEDQLFVEFLNKV